MFLPRGADVLKCFGAILICESVGFLGSIFTTPSIPGWYQQLVKPDIAPPNWVFGPIWTALFALMGIALFLVWRQGFKRPKVKAAVQVFVVQLGLNLIWSILFFGLHSPGAAFAEIICLWLAILATILVFKQRSSWAALLLIPYLAWVTFAAYLNYLIWQLN
jgi:tryptophan-rich sensory protein